MGSVFSREKELQEEVIRHKKRWIAVLQLLIGKFNALLSELVKRFCKLGN